jgi:transcriptional regulator with XRE-family HTH domain
MHALGRFIQQRMDERGWQRREVARRSGLSRQHLADLLDPRRERLGNMIRESTVAGLSRAFEVPETVIISKAAESLGVPVDRLRPIQVTAHDVPDDVLLQILSDRLSRVTQVDGIGAARPQRAGGDDQPRLHDASRLDGDSGAGVRPELA